jgi:hypothetical protein
VPGKRKEGYWRVNVSSFTSSPSCINWRAMHSLNVARPPLYGYAGPINKIFITSKIMILIEIFIKYCIFVGKLGVRS